MVPHKALVDTELCGHKIAKGTQVWPNVWYLAHDENARDDPWSFSPERFLDDQGYDCDLYFTDDADRSFKVVVPKTFDVGS